MASSSCSIIFDAKLWKIFKSGNKDKIRDIEHYYDVTLEGNNPEATAFVTVYLTGGCQTLLKAKEKLIQEFELKTMSVIPKFSSGTAQPSMDILVSIVKWKEAEIIYKEKANKKGIELVSSWENNDFRIVELQPKTYLNKQELQHIRDEIMTDIEACSPVIKPYVYDQQEKQQTTTSIHTSEQETKTNYVRGKTAQDYPHKHDNPPQLGCTASNLEKVDTPYKHGNARQLGCTASNLEKVDNPYKYDNPTQLGCTTYNLEKVYNPYKYDNARQLGYTTSNRGKVDNPYKYDNATQLGCTAPNLEKVEFFNDDYEKPRAKQVDNVSSNNKQEHRIDHTQKVDSVQNSKFLKGAKHIAKGSDTDNNTKVKPFSDLQAKPVEDYVEQVVDWITFKEVNGDEYKDFRRVFGEKIKILFKIDERKYRLNLSILDQEYENRREEASQRVSRMYQSYKDHLMALALHQDYFEPEQVIKEQFMKENRNALAQFDAIYYKRVKILHDGIGCSKFCKLKIEIADKKHEHLRREVVDRVRRMFRDYEKARLSSSSGMLV